MKTIIFALNALAILFCSSMARSEELLSLKFGFVTPVTVPGAVKGGLKAIIGNPKIVDFTLGPNNVFWFVGLCPGTTNIIVSDPDNGAEIYRATIQVGGREITQYILPMTASGVITRVFRSDLGYTSLGASQQGASQQASGESCVTEAPTRSTTEQEKIK